MVDRHRFKCWRYYLSRKNWSMSLAGSVVVCILAKGDGYSISRNSVMVC